MNTNRTARRLLERIKQKTIESNYSEIFEIHIVLGCWESMDPRELERALERLKGNGLLKDTRFIVDKTKPLAKCRYCGNVFEAPCFRSRCRECGSSYMEFIGNRGISLENIIGVERKT